MHTIQDPILQEAVMAFLTSVSETNETNRVLSDLIDIVARYVQPAAYASVILWDARQQLFTAAATNVSGETLSYVTSRIRKRGGATRWILDNRQPLVVEDIENDPFSANTLLREQGLRSYLGVPIQAGDQTLGVLYALGQTVSAYSEADIEFMQLLAAAAAGPIGRTMLHAQLEQSYRELQATQAQLERLSDIKRTFLNDVAHELRTPVTSLNLYLDLYERGTAARQPHYWDAIRASVERLITLAQNVQNFEAVVNDAPASQMQPANLNKIVETITELYRPTATNKELLLTTELDATVPALLANGNQLLLMVDCLLSNAILYTERGTVQVTTHHEAAAQQIILEVVDSGIGISEADLPHVFDRFFRGAAVRRSVLPGTGIGLTMARQICHQIGGTISIDSQLGEGTTVRVALPDPSQRSSHNEPA